MTSQITTSLATYKILDAIDDVRRMTENVMDYYVEMVSVSSGGTISYKYRVFVNYINGIKFVGDLYTYIAETNKLGSLIATAQIPNVVLSHGKLFATNGTPYYVEIRDYTNYIDETLKLMNDYPAADTFCIVSQWKTYDENNYTFGSFYYYPSEHKIEKTNNFINPIDYTMSTSMYIEGLYTNDNGKIVNGVFYLDATPDRLYEKQLCYRITPKPTTSEGEQGTAEPEPEG